MNCIMGLKRLRKKCLKSGVELMVRMHMVEDYLRITRCRLCSFSRSLGQSSREMTTSSLSLKVCSTRRPTSHRTARLSFSSSKTRTRAAISRTSTSSERRQRCLSRHLLSSAVPSRAQTLSRSTDCTHSAQTYGAAPRCLMPKCRSMATHKPITITTIRSRITCRTTT